MFLVTLTATFFMASLYGCAGDGQGGGGGNRPISSLDELQAVIFTPSCDLPGCHDSVTKAGNLSLTNATTSFDQLVNVISTCAGRLQVTPGDEANSYLLDKLGAGAEPCGSPMPLGAPLLSSEQLAMIGDWIAGGALRGGQALTASQSGTQ